MKKLMDLLIMYHEVHRLSRLGLRAAKIARELVKDRRAVWCSCPDRVLCRLNPVCGIVLHIGR